MVCKTCIPATSAGITSHRFGALVLATVIVGRRPRFFNTWSFWTSKTCVPEARAGNPRQDIELMERRRRRQSPFERGRASAPGIGACWRLAHEGENHIGEENGHARREHISAQR